MLFTVCELAYTKEDFPNKFIFQFGAITKENESQFLQQLEHAEAIVDAKDSILNSFADRCVSFCVEVTKHLPRSIIQTWDEFRNDHETFTPFGARLGDLLQNQNQIVDAIHTAFNVSGTFHGEQLQQIVRSISAALLSSRDYKSGTRIYPLSYEGDAHTAYLGHTVFEGILDLRVPYAIPAPARRAHTMMVAGSDRGKTQTLEAMICSDLEQDDPPGMVILDSKGDMFKRLSKLAFFNPDDGRLRDRIILIDPRDNPALNPFTIDLEGKDEETTSTYISQTAYFFDALMGQELSGPMRNVLNPLAQLMLRVPHANLSTLLDALDDIKQKKFTDIFPQLSPNTRRYFERDFEKIVAVPTRNAVKGRIHGLMEQAPPFARMFNADHNALDMAVALNEGKIVLVSTEEGHLHDASSVFGRFIISLANAAALSRTSIPEDQRRQAYLYIDEAGPYFDEHTPKLFRTLRSYGLGIVAAFQDFGQTSAGLLSAMLGSTSIKLVAGGSHGDASVMYRDMNLADASFIFHQGFKHRQYTDWACYVRNATPRAVSLRAPHGYLDRQPQMTDEQYIRFRARNIQRLTDQPDISTPPTPAPPPVIIPSPAPHDSQPVEDGDWKPL